MESNPYPSPYLSHHVLVDGCRHFEPTKPSQISTLPVWAPMALKYSLEFIRNLIFADITSSDVVRRYGVGILPEFQNLRLTKSETPP